MLHEMAELEDGTLVQFHTPCWDTEITHGDLIHLKRIAQRAREGLARAKVGSPVWEAMRFILSSPVESTEEELTWGDHIDYPEPDQTYGAAG